jgi:hypothetical protein
MIIFGKPQMNKQLLKTNYLVVKNFLPKAWAEELYVDFRDHGRVESAVRTYTIKSLDNLGLVHEYKNPVGGLEILYYMTQRMVDIVGERLFPTYAFMRCYNEGSCLPMHTDRPACEVSVSIHLGSDKPWEFIIEDPDQNPTSVILEKGDAIIYLGCVASHGRKDNYDGDHYIQIFLHYVRSRGPLSWCVGDLNKNKRPDGWNFARRHLYDEYKQLLNVEQKH